MTRGDDAALLEEAYARVVAREGELQRAFDEVIESSTLANLDDEHDPEGATVGFERAQLRALLERTRAQRVELDEARARLARDEYGMCGSCGARIGRDRLAAQPATRTCVRCARTG